VYYVYSRMGPDTPINGYCSCGLPTKMECGFSAVHRSIFGGRSKIHTCCLCYQAFRLAATAACRDNLRAAPTGDVHRQIRRLWKLGNRRRQTREMTEGRRMTQGLTLQADLITYVHIHTGFKPYLYWCDCYQVLEDVSSPFAQKIHGVVVAAAAAVGSVYSVAGPYNNPPNLELC